MEHLAEQSGEGRARLVSAAVARVERGANSVGGRRRRRRFRRPPTRARRVELKVVRRRTLRAARLDRRPVRRGRDRQRGLRRRRARGADPAAHLPKPAGVDPEHVDALVVAARARAQQPRRLRGMVEPRRRRAPVPRRASAGTGRTVRHTRRAAPHRLAHGMVGPRRRRVPLPRRAPVGHVGVQKRLHAQARSPAAGNAGGFLYSRRRASAVGGSRKKKQVARQVQASHPVRGKKKGVISRCGKKKSGSPLPRAGEPSESRAR